MTALAIIATVVFFIIVANILAAIALLRRYMGERGRFA